MSGAMIGRYGKTIDFRSGLHSDMPRRIRHGLPLRGHGGIRKQTWGPGKDETFPGPTFAQSVSKQLRFAGMSPARLSLE